MRNILFITRESLKNPTRGTPLRIVSFIKQIARAHRLTVAAPDIDELSGVRTIAYPTGSVFKKARSLAGYIRNQNIEIVMTATDINLFLPILIKRYTGAKIITDLHGLYVEEMKFQRLMPGWKCWVLDKIIKHHLRSYDCVFAVSEKLKAYYRDYNKNIVVVYGGVESDSIKKRSDDEPRIFTIGYTGNAKPYQGIHYLIEAAGALQRGRYFDFRLNFVISSDQEEIKTALKKEGILGITDIKYKIPHSEVANIMAKSHVLIVPRPSLKMTEYAYPSKLPEDLAMGIPVIATEVGPIHELYEGEDVCVIIPAKDIGRNLKEAIIRIHGMSPRERKAMGIRARTFVESRLNWDVLGETINQTLDRL